jgi:uncharacterized protein YecT (DUF1311 family)
MRHALIPVLIAFLPGASHAADFAECDPAGTQLEMNACAVDELDKADAELNAVYADLLEKAKLDLAFVAKLRDAQRAWLTYRDADLDAWFACHDANVRVCWGSMYPMDYAFRKAHLTRSRTAQLREMLSDRAFED